MQNLFLYPLALIGLALLALPIVVHLLNRRKANRIFFPSLRFIVPSQTTLLKVERLNKIPLLLLRLLILGLIVLAAARPFKLPFVSAKESDQAIILIDMSASMGATATWSDALSQARAVINKQPEDSRIAIVGL